MAAPLFSPNRPNMASDKVIFADTRKTVEIELPSFPGSKVTVYRELNVGQQRAVMNAGDDFARGLATAETAIKCWNLYDDETTPTPVTVAALSRLPVPDLTAIFSAIAGVSPEDFAKGAPVKKNTPTA